MTMPSAPFGTFFLPGPTEVRPEVLESMVKPMIAHRGRAFELLFAQLQQGLRAVFHTHRPVFVSSSSATGLMEAGIRCAPAGAVLALVNGAFAERFAQIARACGRDTEVVEVPWGSVVPLDEVERRLRARRFAAMTVVHSETSTGALTDVRAMTRLAREHGALCLVDSVTGVGGAPLEFDAWELDYVLTGSQKALALPPGLGFAVASDAYMRQAAAAEGRGIYFDLVEFERYAAKSQTPNTPALPLLYALERQLALITAAGLDHRIAEHDAMARTTWRWAARLGETLEIPLGVLAREDERSPTVSAIGLPVGISSRDMTTAVVERGYVIGGGYGKLRESTFRIGHMGDHTVATLKGCLEACGDALTALVRAGAAVR